MPLRHASNFTQQPYLHTNLRWVVWIWQFRGDVEAEVLHFWCFFGATSSLTQKAAALCEGAKVARNVRCQSAKVPKCSQALLYSHGESPSRIIILAGSRTVRKISTKVLFACNAWMILDGVQHPFILDHIGASGLPLSIHLHDWSKTPSLWPHCQLWRSPAVWLIYLI